MNGRMNNRTENKISMRSDMRTSRLLAKSRLIYQSDFYLNF